MSDSPLDHLMDGHPLRVAWDIYNEPLRYKVNRPPEIERKLAFVAGWDAACKRNREIFTDRGSDDFAMFALGFLGIGMLAAGVAIGGWLI